MEYKFEGSFRYWYRLSFTERAGDSDPTVGRRRSSAGFPTGKYHDSIRQLRRGIVVRETEVVDRIER